MGKTKAQNLTRLEETLSGKQIEALNNLEPGLGSKIHKLFSNLGNIQAAQSGYSGPVVIAEQKPKTPQGDKPDSMQLQGGRIGQAAPAIRGDQYVTLDQVRAMFNCEYLAGILEDCIDDHLDTEPPKPSCAPINLSNLKSLETELVEIYAVHVQNEFVVVTGNDGSSGHVNTYIIDADNEMHLLAEVDVIAIQHIQNSFLQGRFLYCAGSADHASTKLTIIDVLRFPQSGSGNGIVDLGANSLHAHAQGRFAYVTVAGGIKIVDCSNVLFPVVRGFATGGGLSYVAAQAVGDYLFAIATPATLTIWNASDPENPGSPITFVDLPSDPVAFWVHDLSAYIALDDGRIVVVSPRILETNQNDESFEIRGTADSIGEVFTHILATADAIFASGSESLAIFTMAIPPVLVQKFAFGNAVSQLDIQGRRVFVATADGSELRSYRWGGFYCHAVSAGTMFTDELKAEALKSRHGFFYGSVVASEIHAAGEEGEEDSGVVSAANYFKLGPVFIFHGEGSPEGIFAAPIGSFYVNTDTLGSSPPTFYVKETGSGNTGWVAK